MKHSQTDHVTELSMEPFDASECHPGGALYQKLWIVPLQASDRVASQHQR
jgi:hypothetical protein